MPIDVSPIGMRRDARSWDVVFDEFCEVVIEARTSHGTSLSQALVELMDDLVEHDRRDTSRIARRRGVPWWRVVDHGA